MLDLTTKVGDVVAVSEVGHDTARRGAKVAPNDAKSQSRDKDCTQCIKESAYSFLSSLLLYIDIVTDVAWIHILFLYGHYTWGYASLSFVCVPYCLSMFAITISLCSVLSKQANAEWSCLVCVFAPVIPLLFDLVVPFLPFLRTVLDRDMYSLLLHYEGIRSTLTTMFESMPQIILQIYLFAHCNGEQSTCKFETDDGFVLIWSCTVSILSALHMLFRTCTEKRLMGVTWCGYAEEIFMMGKGFPIKQVLNNSITSIEKHDQVDETTWVAFTGVLPKIIHWLN